MVARKEFPSADIYSFHCPKCGNVLGVPISAAGATGPCPACWQMIVAPPVVNHSVAPPPEPTKEEFIARRAIDPKSLVKDDSWKEANRARRRQRKRLRKFHKGCDSFLQSAFFKWFRVVLGLGILVFVAGTFLYMRSHRWEPWWSTSTQRASTVEPSK